MEGIQSNLKVLQFPYEIIVVCDACTDHSASIACEFDIKLLKNSVNKGSSACKRMIQELACGSIIIFVDADVIAPENCFAHTLDFLQRYPGIDVLFGRLSNQTPQGGFLSQYKNAYMNLMFPDKSKKADFLFGSICFIRNTKIYWPPVKIKCDDTLYGKILHEKGHQIFYKADLMVTHLKRYSLYGLLRNDFLVPYEWTRIFLSNYVFLKRKKSLLNFGHISLLRALRVFLPLLSLFFLGSLYLFSSTVLLWIISNFNFISSLKRKINNNSFISVMMLTFVDQLVMSLGMIIAFIISIFFVKRRSKYCLSEYFQS